MVRRREPSVTASRGGIVLANAIRLLVNQRSDIIEVFGTGQMPRGVIKWQVEIGTVGVACVARIVVHREGQMTTKVGF